jgi:hypothetical protein
MNSLNVLPLLCILRMEVSCCIYLRTLTLLPRLVPTVQIEHCCIAALGARLLNGNLGPWSYNNRYRALFLPQTWWSFNCKWALWFGSCSGRAASIGICLPLPSRESFHAMFLDDKSPWSSSSLAPLNFLLTSAWSIPRCPAYMYGSGILLHMSRF